MTKNIIAVPIFLIFISMLFPFSVLAIESDNEEKPEFVIAVFATKRTRADLLLKAKELNILAYNVNWESQVDLENNCIKKAWVRENDRWVRVEKVPLPDVVYDYGVYKNLSTRKEKVKALKAQLRARGIPFINPEEAMVAVNDKVLFSKVMHDNGIPHPQTLNFKKSALKKLLKKHDLLFMKPIKGSKGYGIIVINKVAGTNSTYSLAYKIKYRGRWITITDRATKRHLYKAIGLARTRLNTTKARYLIQQGIRAFRYGEKNIIYKGEQTDFRLNMQRGQDGKLFNTGFAMRVGGNLSQGGRPADHSFVLGDVVATSGLPLETLTERVVEVAMNTHLALEKHAGKLIGDLGMDVVIDDLGNPYIIEANDKNGYLVRHVRMNPEVDCRFNLPPSLPLCEKMDEEHIAQLIKYSRYLVKQDFSLLKK